MHQRKCVRKGQKEQKYTFLLNEKMQGLQVMKKFVCKGQMEQKYTFLLNEKMQGLQVMKVCLQGANGTNVYISLK